MAAFQSLMGIVIDFVAATSLKASPPLSFQSLIGIVIDFVLPRPPRYWSALLLSIPNRYCMLFPPILPERFDPRHMYLFQSLIGIVCYFHATWLTSNGGRGSFQSLIGIVCYFHFFFRYTSRRGNPLSIPNRYCMLFPRDAMIVPCPISNFQSLIGIVCYFHPTQNTVVEPLIAFNP